jgi:hypothetical protein
MHRFLRFFAFWPMNFRFTGCEIYFLSGFQAAVSKSDILKSSPELFGTFGFEQQPPKIAECGAFCGTCLDINRILEQVKLREALKNPVGFSELP